MYYGVYTSSVVSQTGCVKNFVTHNSEAAHFPPQVQYFCDLCNTHHGFRFSRSLIVSSPKQQEAFDLYCSRNNLEQDVTLT